MSGWMDDARRSMVEVLSALHIQGNSRARWGPCPLCGATKNSSDRRGPIGVMAAGDGWICDAPSCRASGDGYDMIAAKLFGVRKFKELTSDQMNQARAWCAAQGWCTAKDGVGQVPTPRPAPAAPAVVAPVYPPSAEEFWGRCLPLTSGESSKVWMSGRGFGGRLELAERLGLARLAPKKKQDYPDWWPEGRKVWWRLFVAAYDVQGVLRSVHARAIGTPEINGQPAAKTLWPRHPNPNQVYSCSGLFFANPVGVALLRGEEHRAQAVLLVEGLTDWLSAAAWAAEREEQGRARLAVLGGVAGSWRALGELRDRVAKIPVLCGVDQDGAGDNYAAQASEALGRKLPRLNLGRDVNGRRLDVDGFLAAGGDLAEILGAALTGERPGLRAEVLAWWEQNPRATSKDVADRFGIKRDTAIKWRARAGRVLGQDEAVLGQTPAPVPTVLGQDDAVLGQQADALGQSEVTGQGVLGQTPAPVPTVLGQDDAVLGQTPSVTPRPSLTLLTGGEETRQPHDGAQAAAEDAPKPNWTFGGGGGGGGPRAPLDELEARIVEMEVAAGRVGARAELTRLAGLILYDDALVKGLAEARRRGEGRLDQLIFRLKGLPGQVGHAKELAERIAEAARGLADEEVSDGAEGAVLVSEALLGLGRLDGIPGGLVVPFPYGLSVGGVVHSQEQPDGRVLRRRVLARPLVVVALAEQDGGGAWVTLRWWGGRHWEERTVELSTALHRGRIVDIQGLGVSTESARAVVKFIEAFIDTNRLRLPTHAASQQMGWQADGSFLWGKTAITLGGQRAAEGFTPPEGMAGLVAAFKAKGTLAGWLGVMKSVAVHPRVMLAVYAALVPPLLRFLPDAQNFIIDIAGSTSQGKTTALRVAASVWGWPGEDKGVWRSWGSTTSFIERMATLCNDLPVMLDDTKRARDPRFISRVVYQICGGQGDGRATVHGAQEGVSWRTVGLSTGEQGATSYGQNGGAEARAIIVHGNPLPEGSGELIARLVQGLAAHHGQLGPRLVELLMAPGAEEKVRELYDEGRRRWEERVGGDSVLTRLGKYSALLYCAYHLAGELGVPQNPEVWELVGQSAERQAGRADQARAALEAVWEWALARRANFWSLSTKKVPSDGWLGAWDAEGWEELGILPTPLRALLAELGYDTDGVLEEWGRRGWLQRNGRNLTDRIRVGAGSSTSRVRAYVVPRRVLEEVLGIA